MKKLILTALSLLISIIAFSQVITVDVSKIETFASVGKLDPYYVIANKGWDTTQIVSTKYVLDFDKKTSKFYKDGILISTIDFQSDTKKGDTHYITLVDYDLNNPSDQFNTYMVVNPNTNLFMYYWYDDVWDLTKVEVSSNPKIQTKH
jgi:hypothetical protein